MNLAILHSPYRYKLTADKGSSLPKPIYGSRKGSNLLDWVSNWTTYLVSKVRQLVSSWTTYLVSKVRELVSNWTTYLAPKVRQLVSNWTTYLVPKVRQLVSNWTTFLVPKVDFSSPLSHLLSSPPTITP